MSQTKGYEYILMLHLSENIQLQLVNIYSTNTVASINY